MPSRDSAPLRFNEHHVGTIAGAVQERDKRHIIVAGVRRALAAYHTPLAGLMQETGFTPNHIAAMLQGAGLETARAIADLCTRQADLRGPFERLPFSRSDIADMLRGAGRDIGEAIAALHRAEPDLSTIASLAVFTPAEIAAVLARSRRRIDDAAASLAASQPRMLEIKAAGLGPAAVARILHGVGANADEASRILLNHSTMTKALMRQLGFSDSDLGHALAATRMYCGRGIRALVQSSTALDSLLAAGFATHDIAGVVHGSSHEIRKAVYALARAASTVEHVLASTPLSAAALAQLLERTGKRCDTLMHVLADNHIALAAILVPDRLEDMLLVELLRELPFPPAIILQTLQRHIDEIDRCFTSGQLTGRRFVDILKKESGDMSLRITKAVYVDILRD